MSKRSDGGEKNMNVSIRGWFVSALVAMVILGACADDVALDDGERLAHAERFRIDLVGVTGQHHLSISDYATIRDEVCTVDASTEFPGISARWGLDPSGLDADVSNELWTTAKAVCPEVLGDEDSPPFVAPNGRRTSVGLPVVDVALLDVSILGESAWETTLGQQQLIAESNLSVADTVEHFRTGLGGDWQILEAIGPFGGSMQMWSLDLSDGTQSGVINVYERTGTEGADGVASAVIVQIALVGVNYPLE